LLERRARRLLSHCGPEATTFREEAQRDLDDAAALRVLLSDDTVRDAAPTVSAAEGVPRAPTADERRHLAALANPDVDDDVWAEHLTDLRDLVPDPLIISGLHVRGLRRQDRAHDMSITIAPWNDTQYVIVIA
jgi:hypothetical protein